MIWKYGKFLKQTITYNIIGYDSQNPKVFRYIEVYESHNESQIASGMEQATEELTIKSDSHCLEEAQAGDMLILQWDTQRIIQAIEKKPSLKGGNKFSYVIRLK